MGKIKATYLIKVTLREPEAEHDQADVPEAPTIAAVEEAVAAVLSTTGLDANAAAERTDR